MSFQGIDWFAKKNKDVILKLTKFLLLVRGPGV